MMITLNGFYKTSKTWEPGGEITRARCYGGGSVVMMIKMMLWHVSVFFQKK